jgi:hypothetical protein
MFNNPCKCCGSSKHSLLKFINESNTLLGFECPVISHDSVYEMLKEESNERMYRPCPLRFAGLYGHQEEDCLVALKFLDNLGIGRYWTWPIYKEFREKVSEACVNYSRQYTYKRDLSLECFYVEEMEPDVEEHNSSTTA